MRIDNNKEDRKRAILHDTLQELVEDIVVADYNREINEKEKLVVELQDIYRNTEDREVFKDILYSMIIPSNDPVFDVFYGILSTSPYL